MSQVALKVRRQNPDGQSKAPFWQDYMVDMDSNLTVLDALIKVREEDDETLTLRCSCRSSICGSCAMRINGHAGLACKTKITSVMPKNGGPIVIEPMGNMGVMKDLVVDLNPFWDKLRAVTPFVKPPMPEPKGEYVAPPDDMERLVGVMSCILCGACVSDCTALEVDPNFLGPAALAKAYRVITDPRDTDMDNRFKELDKYGGIWDCTRCYECVQVCPKGVAPMDRIMVLRDMAVQRGFDKTLGARHSEGFAELVEHAGSLDELRLVPITKGLLNIKANLAMIPVGLQALTHGKMPPIVHKPIPGVKNVRRIFERVEEDRSKEKNAQGVAVR